MISNNYQNQVNYGAVKDVVPQKVSEKLPQSVQNYDIKERVGENTAVKAAKNAKTDPLTIGLTGAIWLAFAQGCQLLNNNLNNSWDKSWLGKIAAGAEKLGQKLPKSNNGIKNFINKIVDKSAILQSLKTPTKAQNSMAISQARGITGYIMNDVSSMLGYHLKNGKGDDILKLAEGLSGFNGTTGSEALQYIDDLFKNCEQNMPQIKELIGKLSNSDIKVAVENIVNSRINIPFTKIGFNVKIPNIPFLKRQGSFKEMGNKLNAVFENSAGLGKEVTKLGKTLPKQAIKTLEGITNGGAGGKLMIIIQASIFAQAIKKAIDAPKGEKLSTFTENIANDFGFFLSLPLQVKASHAVGGLKYIGIEGWKTAGQEQSVKTLREMIKNLNSKVDAGTISHIDYLKESKKIKEFLKGDSKWYQQPLKFIGKIFSTGLDAETIKPFVDTADKSFGTSVFNKLRNLTNKIKGPGLGMVIRFAIGTMIIGPIIAKGVTKISHLIFGRPTKSVLDKEEDKNKTNNKQQNNPLNMSQDEIMQKLSQHPELINKMQQDPQFLQQMLENPQLMAQYLNGEIKVEDNNYSGLINPKYITGNQNNQVQAKSATPVQPQTQQGLNAVDNSKMNLFGLGKKKEETAQQEETTQQDSLEPVRTYIPSSECMINKDSQGQELNSDVNNALLKAEQAEKRALEQLQNL